MSNPKMYVIPDRFRRSENLHILFWLLKDLGWAMKWTNFALFMIVPTIGVAVLISWQTRKIKSELYHNLAIVCWICANGFWMITELFQMADELRYYTAFPFSAGLLFIAIYYLRILPNEKREEKLAKIEVFVPEKILK
jgi:hypothetical protein